eukprot:6177366-Pleurochrysis_carterae.AAC.3
MRGQTAWPNIRAEAVLRRYKRKGVGIRRGTGARDDSVEETSCEVLQEEAHVLPWACGGARGKAHALPRACGVARGNAQGRDAAVAALELGEEPRARKKREKQHCQRMQASMHERSFHSERYSQHVGIRTSPHVGVSL